MIKLYQSVHGCDYDHCGVIIQNSFGVPYILEITDNGYELHKYSTAILNSLAYQIVLLPIQPRIEFTPAQREGIRKYSEELIASPGQPKEVTLMAKSMLAHIYSKVSRRPSTVAHCPNVNLATECLKKLDLCLSHKTMKDNFNDVNSLTLSDFLSDDSLGFHAIRGNEKVTFNFGSKLFIRSK